MELKKISGSGKCEQEHVPHSFLDVSRCSHANQQQGNVQESVLQLDLLLFFTVLALPACRRLLFPLLHVEKGRLRNALALHRACSILTFD